MSRRGERRGHARAVLIVVAALFALGCNALIGGGVLAVGVVAAVLTYECTEGVGVTVWDASRGGHAICDASVTATLGDKRVAFSPCYAGYLGEGEWTVTAERPGYFTATGTVTIPHDHKCSEPIYHSLELTLRPDLRSAPVAQPYYAPPPGPYSAPPGPYPAPPPAAPAPSPAPSAPQPSGSTAPAAPPPTGVFPSAPATE